MFYSIYKTYMKILKSNTNNSCKLQNAKYKVQNKIVDRKYNTYKGKPGVQCIKKTP